MIKLVTFCIGLGMGMIIFIASTAAVTFFLGLMSIPTVVIYFLARKIYVKKQSEEDGGDKMNSDSSMEEKRTDELNIGAE